MSTSTTKSTTTSTTVGYGMTESSLAWLGKPLHRVKNASNRKKYEFAVIYIENEPGLVVPWLKPGLTPPQWLQYAADMTRRSGGVFERISYYQ